MKHIDIILEFFATEQDKWNETYFSKLPYEMLQMIFNMKRQGELLQYKATIHKHMLCRRRSFGKNIFNYEVLQYPYFSSNKIKIEHVVSVNGNMLRIRIKFSKLRSEYSELFSNKQHSIQRPHFTIGSECFFDNLNPDDSRTGKTEFHYQISDWKFSNRQSKIGKCL